MCGVHLMEKSIARVIDKKLDFEKDGGIDTPVILFRCTLGMSIV